VNGNSRTASFSQSESDSAGNDKVVFTYQVQSGDGEGSVSLGSGISLNGATIQDAAGNDANNDLSGKSISANVDTTTSFATDFPKATAGSSSGDLKVSADMTESTDVWYVVVDSTSTTTSEPTAAQIKAGEDSTGSSVTSGSSASPTASFSETKSGLSTSKTFDVYVLIEDDNGNQKIKKVSDAAPKA
jgi:hypothetical protein